MSAALLWTRSLWRHHWRATILVGVFVGLAAGAAMTAWEYSRRAGSAVDRWVEFVQPPTARAEGCPPGVTSVTPECFGFSMTQTLYDALDDSPLLSGVQLNAGLPVVLTAGDRSVSTTLGRAVHDAGVIDRPLVVSGRVPNSDATAELTLAPKLADALAVGVGDDVSVQVCDWQFVDQDAPCTDFSGVRVVGLVENLDSLTATRNAPPGRAPRIAGRGVSTNGETWEAMAAGHQPYGDTLVRVAAGVSLDEVNVELAQALPGYFVRAVPADEVSTIDAIRRTVDLERTALWALALMMFVVAAVFSAQVLARQARREMADRDVVRSFGAGRIVVGSAAAMRNVPTAVVAALTAWAVTVVASRFGPRGLAGRLEATSGMRLDATVVLLGAVAIVLGTLAVSATAVALASRRLRPRSAGPLSRRLAAASPVIRSGWSLGGAGRRQFLWPAAAGIASAVLVVGVASSLSGNLRHTRTTPAAFGAAWQYGVTSTDSGGLTTEEDGNAAAEQVLADPVVDSAAFLFSSIPLRIEGASLFRAVALRSVKGTIAPVVVDGRAPATADEVALGPRTLAELGLAVGDQMPALPGQAIDPESLEVVAVTIGPYDIVGVALVNNDDDDVGPGKGALLTEEGLLRIEGDLGDVALVVTTDGSLTPDAEAAHFTETFGPFLTVPSPQVDITNLQPIAAVPWAIAWFLGLLAAAVLFHALVNCTQLGRRQLSTMRALGFQSGQTRRSVVALAGLLAIPSALVGAGAGIVAGRWAWSLVSNRIGLASAGRGSWGLIAAAGALAILTALLVAMVPARAAGSRELLEGLHAE